MVVSSMGSKEGRIVQAHVTNSGVVVQKSKLYSFKSAKDLKNSGDLFSRYMASRRIGDTRRHVSLDINNHKSKS